MAVNFYDQLFLVIYLLIASTLLIYKNSRYPLPAYALACEVVVLVMLCFTQLIRYVFAKKSIVDRSSKFVLLYLAATLFVLLSYIFGLALQTYVLLIEVVTNWAGIALAVLETLSGLWVLNTLQRKKQIS